MRILERYTLRAFLAPLAWCLTIFLGLYLVLDLLGHLDEILRHKVPLRLLATYYGTMVPIVFAQVAPFACLVAAGYTLGNLNRHQELMAMRASGIGPWAIIRPLVAVGLLMSGLVFVIQENLTPGAAAATQSIKANYLERPPDPSKPHQILRTIHHLAAYGQGHALLYAKTFDPVEKKMEGIVILQQGPDLRLIRKVTADEARWTGSQWRFYRGTILHFNSQGESIGKPVPFEAKIIRAGDRPEILEKSESQAEFMNMKDLNRYVQRLAAAGGATTRKLKVDLYAKPAAALACLVLTIVGIPFAVTAARGAGAVLGLSMGLAVGLVFYGVNSLGLAMGKGGWLPPLAAAWAVPLLFLALGLRLTWRRLA